MPKELQQIAENKPEESDILDLKPDAANRLVEAIMLDFDYSDGARTQWLKDKEEGLALYWGIRKTKDFPFKNCANLHVPLIRTIADTLHSNIMGSLDMDKPVSTLPVGPEDVRKAREIERILNWQFTTQVDYADLVDKVATSALVYGMAAVKVRYVVERDGDRKRFDGIVVDVLQPERFLFPPDAAGADVQKMDYCIHEIPMSKSDLKKRMRENGYAKIDDDELDRFGHASSKTETEVAAGLETIRNFQSGQETAGAGRALKRHLIVLEWHGYFDHNDDGIDEPVMATVLKDGRKLLRVVRARLKRPFVLVQFSGILHKAAGESVPDLLKSVNLELNTLHNQRVDAVTVSNTPYFFYDPASGYNPNDVALAPGVGIPTNGPPNNAVYFPQFAGIRPEMYREEELLFLYAERMLGAGINVQGIQTKQQITATETAITDRRAGIRFLTVFNRIRSGLRNIFRLALELDREHMPPETQARISGLGPVPPVFETIRRESLDAEVDIIINGNSAMDDQAEKADSLRVYQIGMSNPLIARDEMAVYEMTKDMLLKLGVKRIDAYLRKPDSEIPISPEEEHNMFLQEEYVKPNLNERIDDHMEKHSRLINSDQFKLLSRKGQILLMKHYAATENMKAAIEKMSIVNRLFQVNAALLRSQMAGDIPPDAMPGIAAAHRSGSAVPPSMPAGAINPVRSGNDSR